MAFKKSKPVITEATAESHTVTMLRGMKAKLAKCKKVMVEIPLNPLNPKDTDVTVQINGYVYVIKRGVEVEVPAPVRKLLKRAKYI